MNINWRLHTGAALACTPPTRQSGFGVQQQFLSGHSPRLPLRPPSLAGDLAVSLQRRLSMMMAAAYKPLLRRRRRMALWLHR